MILAFIAFVQMGMGHDDDEATFSVLLSQGTERSHEESGGWNMDGRRRSEEVLKKPVLERLHVGFYVVWYNEIYIIRQTFFFDDTH
jgi:hypothetical protein